MSGQRRRRRVTDLLFAPRAHARRHAGVGTDERRRLLGVRALAGRPPVGRDLVGERGDGGFDAHRVFAGVFTVERAQRVTERDRDLRAMERAAFAQHPSGAVEMDRHDGYAGAQGDERGAAAERLTPTVGRATAFGEDQQAPSVVDEPACEVGRLAPDLGALDGNGADDERRRARRSRAVPKK